MLHLQPLGAPESNRQPYAEAVARLASVRHALRLVDPHGGGPADDMNDEAIAAGWEVADDARRHSFDLHSAEIVAATAQGVDALLANQSAGMVPHQEASRLLVEEIRRELEALSINLLR